MTREELGISVKGEAYIDAVIAWGNAEWELRKAKRFYGWGRIAAAEANLTRAHSRMDAARDAAHEESMQRYRTMGIA
jgi:hypothetical protein